MSRLWDKGEPLDDLVLQFTVGDDHLLDRRLVPYDVRASIAHGSMLQRAGYLSAEDFAAIERTLKDLQAEFEQGSWTIELHEEDVHTALENRLVERLGEAGKRLHLGRSRNDQVLVALRLYLRDVITSIGEQGTEVVNALDALADDQGEIPLPGYTHLQRAMPSSVALWSGGYAQEIRDDLAGVERARARIASNPLGSAAGYGVPALDLDRHETTKLLEFKAPHQPVTAVQLSRGKAEATVLFELGLLMQDLGRLASDLCLFATAEFSFVSLPASMTTGSSIMPQKRNPDVFELIRGHASQAFGDLAQVLQLTNKLPSGYHRELQLIKRPLFRGIDIASQCLRILSRAIPSIRFEPASTEKAMDPSLFATEEAYRMVRDEGIPFREAYRRVGARFQD